MPPPSFQEGEIPCLQADPSPDKKIAKAIITSNNSHTMISSPPATELHQEGKGVAAITPPKFPTALVRPEELKTDVWETRLSVIS